MSSLEISHFDLEQQSDDTCFSDAEDGSCYSLFYSTAGGSSDDYSFSCISDPEITEDVRSDSRRVSSVSEFSVEIEGGVLEIKVELNKKERICRICHLGLESNCHESGMPIELGCSCKDDLGTAHKQCAETWFDIKGNKTCEICHSIARNVVGATEIESIGETNEANNSTTEAAAVGHSEAENRRFLHGHRFLHFLLACVVFAFVISWLFRFNVPSS